MNFTVLREVENLRFEVQSLRNERKSPPSLTCTTEPLASPMTSVEEYEELTVKLQRHDFKND